MAWLNPNVNSVYVQDVADAAHPVTLCKTPPGNVRFISPRLIVVWNPGDVSTFDLVTAASTEVLTYDHNDGPVLSMDWTPDRQFFAYGRLAPNAKSVAIHLVSRGSDRVVTTIATPNGAGIGGVRVEFSPGGNYLAIGAVGSVKTGEKASVQVRGLDGRLLFSSGGSAQLTWAGETTKLYFDSGHGIETWDPLNGAKALPETAWYWPSRSPDGRWLAYQTTVYPGVVRTIDTRTGADKPIARSTSSPQWVTSSQLRFDLVLSCPPPASPPVEANPCATKSVIYNTGSGSIDDSTINNVFSVWPPATPAW